MTGTRKAIKLQDDLHNKSESYFTNRGERMALGLFRRMATRVPAYRDFLRKNKIKAGLIKNINDFRQVPTIDKDNYLRAYPRKALVWDGKFDKQSWSISATSGSTGEPYYFPRTKKQDEQYALTAELYLREQFEIQKKSTLYIVGFPMGVWIGGVFTYRALTIVAERGGYPLSVITPGISKADILNAVRNLGHEYDQIIIGSYAPFLKDILDDAAKNKVSWRDYRVGFVFSAEVFSETFRDYVVKKTGLVNLYQQTLNHYGTVDMGTMAHETPAAVAVRRLATVNRNLYTALFDVVKLPTLAQYFPEHFYFEAYGGNLICSAGSGIPLVRYDLKDRGGLIGLEEMSTKISRAGLSLKNTLETCKIQNTLWNLPFVYVYERGDMSVSFYAFQVYPETVRKALQKEEFEKWLTTKFALRVYYDQAGNQIFEVNAELRPRIKKSKNLNQDLTREIVTSLLNENSEYRKTFEVMGERVYPKVVFWKYEHSKYFRPGTKQKWIVAA